MYVEYQANPVLRKRRRDRETYENTGNCLILDCREKLLARLPKPVPKPTQVGGERILRCAGKPYVKELGKMHP